MTTSLASGDAGMPSDPEDFASPGSAALYYARHGWAVVPCHIPIGDGACSCSDPECRSQGKHPRTLHGVHDATKDPVQIREWWERRPDANVGLATGAASGIVVLDVDPRSGGDDSLIALERAVGRLPDTPVALTGGGGQHWYFRYAPGLPSHLPGLPGLDILSDGQIVMACPSLHMSGARYEWELSSRPQDVPLAALPDLSPLLPEAKVRPILPGPERIPVGSRNRELFRVGGAMRRVGASPEAIEAALLTDNALRCEVPLDEGEVRKAARSVLRYEPAAVSLPASRVTGSIEYLDLEAYRAQGIPPVQWIVEGWLARKDIALIVGPGGIGKSTTAVDLAVACATGRGWCGVPTAPLDVLLFDEEQDEATAARLVLRLLGDLPVNRLLVAVGQSVRLDSQEGVARFEREIAIRRPGLVILDSVQQVFGRTEENSATEVGAIYAVLFRLRDQYGVTFLLVHHRKKPGKDARLDALDVVRGSTAHGTQSSTVWLASAAGPNRLELAQAKRRGAPKKRLHVTYQEQGEDGPITLVGADLGVADTSAQARAETFILEFLADVGEARRKDIFKAGEGQHAEATLERALGDLTSSKTVAKPRRGLYRLANAAEATASQPPPA